MLNELKDANKYIVEKIKENDQHILEMEAYAREHNVPIITKEVAEYLKFTVSSYAFKNILEIGTAIGYSGTIMAKEIEKLNGKLTSIEIDEERFLVAKKNIEKSKLNNVELILGDALEKLPELKGKYDFIFMDASKGKYREFFDLVYPKLEEGGLIFIDNIMFRGYLYGEYPKRFKTIVRKLEEFIEYLYSEYNFVLLPFGDGIGLVSKVSKK